MSHTDESVLEVGLEKFSLMLDRYRPLIVWSESDMTSPDLPRAWVSVLSFRQHKAGEVMA